MTSHVHTTRALFPPRFIDLIQQLWNSTGTTLLPRLTFNIIAITVISQLHFILALRNAAVASLDQIRDMFVRYTPVGLQQQGITIEIVQQIFRAGYKIYISLLRFVPSSDQVKATIVRYTSAETLYSGHYTAIVLDTIMNIIRINLYLYNLCTTIDSMQQIFQAGHDIHGSLFSSLLTLQARLAKNVNNLTAQVIIYILYGVFWYIILGLFRALLNYMRFLVDIALFLIFTPVWILRALVKAISKFLPL